MRYRSKISGILVVLMTLAVSHLSFADALSVSRKADIPLYQNESMTRSTILGAAGGLAAGAGVGMGLYQMWCHTGVCPNATRTFLPSILVGAAIGAGVGAVIGQISDRHQPVMVYPSIGIGTHSYAPALMVQGEF